LPSPCRRYSRRQARPLASRAGTTPSDHLSEIVRASGLRI
jgi:hypothetical protein